MNEPLLEPTALAELVAEASGAPLAAVELSPRPALNHHTNQLYDAWAAGRRLIVKEFLRPATRQADAAREFGALQRLALLDIAPQPVFFEPARGAVVIYEFMPGEMWDRRRPTARELDQLAGAWLKLNSVGNQGIGLSRGYERSLADVASGMRASFLAYSEWAGREFHPGQRAAELCLGLLESRQSVMGELAAEQAVLCFCRADPRFANVIQRPDGRIGFVDWEGSGLRDPATELADILTHPNQEDLLSASEWQSFLQPYLAGHAGRDARLMQRTQLYLALFPIYFVSVILSQGRELASRGQLAGWDVNGLAPNLRLRRYLARARAWPEAAFEAELERLGEVQFFPEG